VTFLSIEKRKLLRQKSSSFSETTTVYSKTFLAKRRQTCVLLLCRIFHIKEYCCFLS